MMTSYKAVALPMIKHKSMYNLSGCLHEVEDERLLEMREVAKVDISLLMSEDAAETVLVKALDEFNVILRSIDVSDIVSSVGSAAFVEKVMVLSRKTGKIRDLADECLEALTFQGEGMANHLILQKFLEKEHLKLSTSILAQTYIDITESLCRISEYSQQCRDCVMNVFSINEIMYRIRIYEDDPRLIPLMKLISSYSQFYLSKPDSDTCFAALEIGIGANMRELLPIIASGVYRLILNRTSKEVIVEKENIIMSLLKRNGEDREADEFIYLIIYYSCWHKVLWPYIQVLRVQQDALSEDISSHSAAAALALGNIARYVPDLLHGVDVGLLYQTLHSRIQQVSFDHKTSYLYSILCIASISHASSLANEWMNGREAPVLEVFSARLSQMYTVAIDALRILIDGMVASNNIDRFQDDARRNGLLDSIKELLKEDEMVSTDKERLTEMARYLVSNK